MDRTNEEIAVKMYADGESVSAVAKVLGISWHLAKKLNPNFKNPNLQKMRANTASVVEAEVAADADDVEMRSLELEIPAGRTVDIFGAFSLDEQMMAIATVLQERMNAVLNPAG